MSRNLDKIIANEAYLWGDEPNAGYFERAELMMEDQWRELIYPFISQAPLDFSVALDLAAGKGRNSAQLKRYSDQLIVVDVNPENIASCKIRFADQPGFRFVHNNGYDLSAIDDNSVSFIYCFDAMVHFDIEVIIPYIKEFYRILKPDGFGFCHHSNNSSEPGKDFTKSRCWRNFMSKELFAHLLIHNGLEMTAQQLMDWKDAKDIDCLTLFHKVDKEPV